MTLPLPATTDALAAHPRRWLILAVLCLSLLMVVIDNTIVNVALPTLSTELDASTTELQWIVDAYTLVFSALLLAFGHFGDRFGRKLALQLGLVIFALTSVLAALATTSTQLIGARALMGIGAAFVFPATLAILVNVFTDRRERAAAIGIWSACTGVAVALGPVVGGYLLEHFAWGSIFLVNLPLAALAIIAGWFLVPTSRDPVTRTARPSRAAPVGSRRRPRRLGHHRGAAPRLDRLPDPRWRRRRDHAPRHLRGVGAPRAASAPGGGPVP